MRTSIDSMLVHQVVERYQPRLTEPVLNLMGHPSTELYLGLYKRGYWFFQCKHTLAIACIRQVPTGKADDIRLRYVNFDEWVPSATETKQ